MTFDDWMLIKDKSYVPTDDSMQLRLLRECWFSRDAEVAELVAALNPFGAIGLVESRLPAEFAMLILRARAAIAKVRKP